LPGVAPPFGRGRIRADPPLETPRRAGARRGPRLPTVQVPSRLGRLMPSRRLQALREEYRRFHSAGAGKIRIGEEAGALADFEAALAIAKRMGDIVLQHDAQANLSMAYIQLGENRKGEKGLRELLLNSREPKTRFGAAYNLAISLRKQGRHARALFY